MSLVKAIRHGKEHRKTYRERGKCGEFDLSCRPHGGGHSRPCPLCERARLVHVARLEADTELRNPAPEEPRFKADDDYCYVKVPDYGPWIVMDGGKWLGSDDFHHDVSLRINGDFAEPAHRLAYAEDLARRLNAVPPGVVTPRRC